VVDDELLVRVGLRSLADWESAGYRLVAEAADGEEALSAVGRYDPDIVVTDLVMPNMDGFALVRALREAGSTAGIVILTCKNDFDSAREALRLGADDYVFKLTLRAEELLDAFSRVAEKRPQGVKLSGGVDTPQGNTHSPHLDCPHRILALALRGGGEGLGPMEREALLRQACAADPSILALYEGGTRIAVANGPRNELERSFTRIHEFIYRYSGSRVSGAYSALVCDPSSGPVALSEAGKTLRQGTFGANRILAFAEDGLLPDGIDGKRYASACVELSRATDSLDLTRVQAALVDIAGTLRSGTEESRLRALLSDALIPFRLLSRSLSLDSVGEDTPNLDDLIDTALTLDEAVDGIVAYARVFVPIVLRRIGLREEIAAVQSWVLADLSRPYSVEAASEIAGMSPSHFAHQFKAGTGYSFIDFVNRARMERARELLLSTDLLVREIASMVGVENVAWFGVLFKRLMGSTPNDVRERRGGSCS